MCGYLQNNKPPSRTTQEQCGISGFRPRSICTCSGSAVFVCCRALFVVISGPVADEEGIRKQRVRGARSQFRKGSTLQLLLASSESNPHRNSVRGESTLKNSAQFREPHKLCETTPPSTHHNIPVVRSVHLQHARRVTKLHKHRNTHTDT